MFFVWIAFAAVTLGPTFQKIQERTTFTLRWRGSYARDEERFKAKTQK